VTIAGRESKKGEIAGTGETLATGKTSGWGKKWGVRPWAVDRRGKNTRVRASIGPVASTELSQKRSEQLHVKGTDNKTNGGGVRGGTVGSGPKGREVNDWAGGGSHLAPAERQNKERGEKKKGRFGTG